MLFYLLRDKGIHITEGRTWFFTTAHDDNDYSHVVDAFKNSVIEMQINGLLPGRSEALAPPVEQSGKAEALKKNTFSSDKPPVIGAKLGRNPDGDPAWFVPDSKRPGKYLQVG